MTGPLALFRAYRDRVGRTIHDLGGYKGLADELGPLGDRIEEVLEDEARALPDPTEPRTTTCSCDWPGCQGQCHTGPTCPCHPADRTAQVAAIAAALHASQRWCDGAESLSFRTDTTEDDARVAVDVHGADAAALYDAGLRSGALPEKPRTCVLAVNHQGLHRDVTGEEWSWFETTLHHSPALAADAGALPEKPPPLDRAHPGARVMLAAVAGFLEEAGVKLTTEQFTALAGVVYRATPADRAGREAGA